ncbi:flagellar export protein FliJ [Tepidibacillus sp. LV47]|uniref:flagellar export protein FliJ n=1 Tax=Tepidibacillus sp. LV47 TaxID=3398228 RepID=UPI003AABBDFF
MKKFQFHLQKVIDIKEKNRELVEWSYTKILNDLQKEEKKLADLFSDKQQIEKQLSDEQKKGITIIKLQQVYDYLAFLRSQINQQKEMIKKQEHQLQEKKDELKEAKIEEKIWHHYKDKRLQEYLLESKRDEQKQIDELATYRSYY